MPDEPDEPCTPQLPEPKRGQTYNAQGGRLEARILDVVDAPDGRTVVYKVRSPEVSDAATVRHTVEVFFSLGFVKGPGGFGLGC